MKQFLRLLLIAALVQLALGARAYAQPVLTVNDAFGVDAWKEDVSRVGFKVQVRFDAATVWSDVPATTIEQVVLADTATGYITLRMPVSATTAGSHTLRLRYCDGATCSAETVFAFTFSTGTPLPALRAPLNPRVVPKSGGTAGAVDTFGWLMDVPRAVRQGQ